MMEQMMNLDLKAAYDYGIQWIKLHHDITVDWLVLLASKVMARTGSEYHAAGGDFSAAKGELRKLNVTAGLGGLIPFRFGATGEIVVLTLRSGK